jgi:hypothetical protein
LMKLPLPPLLSVIPKISRALNASLTEGREVPNFSAKICSQNILVVSLLKTSNRYSLNYVFTQNQKNNQNR